MTPSTSPTGCCDPFDPILWQDKEISWKEKLFVKDHVMSFLHIPLNFGQKIVKNLRLIEKAGAQGGKIMLSDEKSLWGADIFIDVDRIVPGAAMATLSGTFLTKVFEGPYKDAGKWAKEMIEVVRKKGRNLKKILFFYTTCPKCAKVYGKNYVVLLGQVG
jgi:hypothetical protein